MDFVTIYDGDHRLKISEICGFPAPLRTIVVLSVQGIDYVDQLLQMTREEVLKLKRMTPELLDQLKPILIRKGLMDAEFPIGPWAEGS